MKDYFIGFDIGTDSIGWAVTDTQYNLIRFKGKDLWGIRLFNEALKADERRGFRTARRRLERRKQRIDNLQMIFNEEISKVDRSFFMRLEESKFMEDDKKVDGKFALFNDDGFTDKEFHNQYPTIYHLRKALLDGGKEFDVRLVYLAIHHIMKNRGHFLFEDMSLDAINFESCMQELQDYLASEYESVKLNIGSGNEFSEVLTNRNLGVKGKYKELERITGIKKPKKGEEDTNNYKLVNAMLNLLAGGTAKTEELFGIECEEKKSFSFKENFEDVESKVHGEVGDAFELVLKLKAIYDWALLAQIRKGHEFLSEYKVESYDEHAKDLKLLKSVLNRYGDKKLKKEILKDKGEKSYAVYTGHGTSGKRCNYEEFRKFVEGKLKDVKKNTDNEQLIKDFDVILKKLELESFLPLQVTKDNGVIPQQLHFAELEKIIENASEYLSFLKDVDESGISNGEKIKQLFKFRIPYYVGPLGNNKEHAWAVRREGENGKIYPWNFEKIIDVEASAEGFIRRMTAKCTYTGCDVIPKQSLLYSKFMVLNELNNLKINGEDVSVELKQAIYNDLFMKGNKVTASALKKYLKSEQGYKDEIELTGFDKDFKSNLASYKAYEWLVSKPNGEKMAENIIKHIVLFGDEKKMLKRWIKNEYGNVLTEEEQNKAIKQKFKDWGRFSEELLTGITDIDAETGELVNIIDAMWNTNYNFMELLSDSFGFRANIEAFRKEKFAGKKYTLQDKLDDSYASPGIKRAIHQVIGLLSEIEKIMKCEPKRIFVETTRSNLAQKGEKGRKKSRKERLMELYKSCGEQSNELYRELENLDDAKLRRDKLYLYYIQLGKSMYSGKTINIDRLDQDYDIDHIYPQSLTKDDSLNNRVLVEKTINATKTDIYPISKDIRDKMTPFWFMLKSKGLIEDEKFNRLTRYKPLTDDELASFINRQIVETNQSTKIVIELMKQRYNDTDGGRVIYSKAENVTEFRKQRIVDENGKDILDPLFVKCRDINDLHHAKDAYLNIVVGNAYFIKFSRSPKSFIKNSRRDRDNKPIYSLRRMYDYDIGNSKEIAWIAGDNGTMATVRNTMKKNNILYTRMAFEVKGGFYDQMIMPKGKGQALLKSSDSRMAIEKFGGYNKMSGAHFMLVEHTEKKKRVRSIETVFVMNKKLYDEDPIKYCVDILKLVDPKIILPAIKIDSLFELNGFRMHISGRSGSSLLFKNANQLILDPEYHALVKNITKYLERCREANKELEITEFDGITSENNLKLYDALTEKLGNDKYSVKLGGHYQTVKNARATFESLPISVQCSAIKQVLRLLTCKSMSGAGLDLIGGSKTLGVVQTSKNVSNMKDQSFKLITQSITGVYEKSIDLLNMEDK